MKILACDIDECTLDVWPTWLRWCNVMFDRNETPESVGYNYDLRQVFGELAMQFWSTPSLYDFLEPKLHCSAVLYKLKKKGWSVGFVSYTKKGHFDSKCKFINDWFPWKDFIHNTKEKSFTRCTHFADDRNKYLNQQPEDVVAIKFKTPYTQDEELKRNVIEVESWKEIYDLLEG